MKILLVLILTIILNLIIIFQLDFNKEYNFEVSCDLSADYVDSYQFFYTGDQEFTVEQSESLLYENINSHQKMEYTMPNYTKKIRFDIGWQPNIAEISNIKISYLGKSIDITNSFLDNGNEKNTLDIRKSSNGAVRVESSSDDGYIIIDLSKIDLSDLTHRADTLNNITKIFVCLVFDLLVLILIKFGKIISQLFREIITNRRLIWNLSKNDFKTKYAGSYLGIFWAFVQPIITVLIYWFVFQVGFRTPSVENCPFIIWLVAGLVPWFFFSESVINATNSMLEYSYLVKKVVFNISILPVVKVISALFIHVFFIFFAILICSLYGYMPTIYTGQVLYYTFCMIVLSLGISYITSAIIVFFKDLGQIVAIILQIAIWMTPIMWNYNILPSKYHWILKINPMFYIVQGYRDSLIDHVWITARYNQMFYFWSLTIILFIIGAVVFRKLKVHFADVL